MTTIADRLANAQHRIELAAKKIKRDANNIQLLAVSKTKPIADIIAAYEAGQRLFGENYVQEGENKVTSLKNSHPDIVWHFIGPLQSNKTKVIATHFDWIHTVAREKIAQRLNQQRADTQQPLNVCIQVNISNEQSKSGIAPSEVTELANIIATLPKLKLRGVMAIPTATTDTSLQLDEFQQLQQIYNKLQQEHATVDTLSMGMSGDLEQAIAAGSTMVRIGSAIFGAREYKQN